MTPSTTIRRQHRKDLPVVVCQTTLEPRMIREKAWNICVVTDRRGRLDDRLYLNQRLGREFGAYIQDRREWPIIRRTVQDYRRARSLAQGPLRVKTLARVKTVPLPGLDLDRYFAQAKTLRGIQQKDVVSAQLRYEGKRVFLRVIHEVPRTEPKHRPLVKKLKAMRNGSSSEEIGLALTPSGLHVRVTTQRKNAVPKLYHIAVEHVLAPGFIQELYRRVIEPRAHTVGLDLSMMPKLSSSMRRAGARLHCWLRSRKAAGAIEYGKVTPVGGETQDCVAFASSVGLSTQTLRSLLRVLRRNAILTCPHCGAPVTVKLDPKTLAPVDENGSCHVCCYGFRAGHSLAARASAYVLYDWTTGALSPQRPRP